MLEAEDLRMQHKELLSIQEEIPTKISVIVENLLLVVRPQHADRSYDNQTRMNKHSFSESKDDKAVAIRESKTIEEKTRKQ